MNQTAKIAVGDLVIREKIPGLINHVGVMTNGTVFHNTPERGEHDTTLADFSQGRPIKVVRTKVPASRVLENVTRLRRNPKKYDLLGRNCEHTATETLFGHPRSPLVNFVFGLAAVLLVGMLFLSRR
jgi:hypothetical protein